MFFLFVAEPFTAQENREYSSQIWFDFNPTYYFSPAFQISAEFGYHRLMNTSGWRQIIFSPFVRTWLGKKMNFYAGLDNTYTFNEAIEDRLEVRPYQSVAFRLNVAGVVLRNRAQLEERFDFSTADWSAEKAIRFRYKLGTFHRWDTEKKAGRYWEVKAAAEIFLNLWGGATQFQEQARIILGIDKSFAYDKYISFEITWQKEKFFNSNPVSDVYFRLRWFQYWGRF